MKKGTDFCATLQCILKVVWGLMKANSVDKLERREQEMETKEKKG